MAWVGRVWLYYRRRQGVPRRLYHGSDFVPTTMTRTRTHPCGRLPEQRRCPVSDAAASWTTWSGEPRCPGWATARRRTANDHCRCLALVDELTTTGTWKAEQMFSTLVFPDGKANCLTVRRSTGTWKTTFPNHCRVLDMAGMQPRKSDQFWLSAMEAGYTELSVMWTKISSCSRPNARMEQSLGKATSSAAEDGITTGYYGMRTSDERFYTI